MKKSTGFGAAALAFLAGLFGHYLTSRKPPATTTPPSTTSVGTIVGIGPVPAGGIVSGTESFDMGKCTGSYYEAYKLTGARVNKDDASSIKAFDRWLHDYIVFGVKQPDGHYDGALPTGVTMVNVPADIAKPGSVANPGFCSYPPPAAP